MERQKQTDQFVVTRVQPKMVTEGKSHTWLASSDILSASVQVIAQGGENNLHHHPNTDQFWLVLHGKLVFHGDGDVVVTVLGPQDGLLVPRGVRYWFESQGAEPCTVMRFAATLRGARDERLDDSDYHLKEVEEGVFVNGLAH